MRSAPPRRSPEGPGLLIDGSFGEGGGQILRTSLTASLLTGRQLRIHSIRAGRRPPGLRPQHLAAVRAAAAVGKAEVEGAELGSTSLRFSPAGLRPGAHRFQVGTAGSVSLVLQTVLPPLLTAPEPSRLTVHGGTHNPGAPPFDFLELTYLPLVSRTGARLSAHLDRHGFHPAGGGTVSVNVEPAARLRPLRLLERGPIADLAARALLSRLPHHIGERELAVVAGDQEWADARREIEEVEADGPGNALLLVVRSARVTEVFTGFGRRGLPAERVAEAALAEARAYRAAAIPVGPYLADQLLVVLARAGGAFRTMRLTSHFRTNAHVLGRTLGAVVSTAERPDGTVDVEVAPGT